MSERYRGTSPTQAKKVFSEDAQQAGVRAKEAFQKRNQKKQDFFSQYAYQIVIGGFVLLVVIAFGNALFSKSRNPEKTPVIEDDEIASHNAQQHSYQLGANEHFADWMLSDAKNSLNSQLSSKQNLNKCPTSEASTIIPDNYNFREQYPKCSRSSETQGKCAASYALSVASSISDRLCQSQGKNVDLSGQPLVSCDEISAGKCQGGFVSRSFDYTKKNGLPEKSCFEYSGESTAECDKLSACETHKITDSCVLDNEESIKREIFENGPVVAVMPAYRDFFVYKSGIFDLVQGSSAFRSGQAVKIIGWGTEEITNRNFWIVESSWGNTWGENGTARVYAREELNLSVAMAAVVSQPQQQQEQQQEQN